MIDYITYLSFIDQSAEDGIISYPDLNSERCGSVKGEHIIQHRRSFENKKICLVVSDSPI